MIRFKFELKYKGGILVIIMLILILAATFRVSAEKQFWIDSLNITVLISGCLVLFIFIVWFYSELLQFRSQPEMAQQIIERDRKIMELQVKFDAITKNEPKEAKQ